MTAIVSIETVVLVLLVVLVIGLLRSHAEILRRLGPREQAPVPSPPTPSPPRTGQPAPALTGTTPDGDAVVLDFSGHGRAPTLLAFLTTGCTTCQAFWESLGEPRLPQDVATVIVAHGTDRESPSRIRRLAPRRIPVVMSSAAWGEYRVPGAPYFVFVDGTIRGEGVATTWDALASLLGDAIEDERAAGAQARGRHIDDVFAAAGIGPEHPSLYPGGRQP